MVRIVAPSAGHGAVLLALFQVLTVIPEIAIGKEAQHQGKAVIGRVVDNLVQLRGILLVQLRIEIHHGLALLPNGVFRPI